MKKLLIAVCMLLGLTVSSYAQQVKPAKPVKTSPVTTAKKPVAVVTTTKKDGTPDMRFAANKATHKKATPTKKDGTPDMRYKNNKVKKAG